jgi:hypothetical protein
MFSSPKGSFNALIYMHRYRPDTVSVVLNDYLREFIRKLEGERAQAGKAGRRFRSYARPAHQGAQGNGGSLSRSRSPSSTEWERDVIFPLAQQKNRDRPR